MHQMTQKEILADMHERLGKLEGYLESLHAQMHTDRLERAKWVATQRRLIEHCERLMRAKEVLLEALGKVKFDEAQKAVEYYSTGDLERFYTEMARQ
jgi:hypothetical protein